MPTGSAILAGARAADRSARLPSHATTRRVQPVRAIRALRDLVADKDDTRQVFEIMNALSGRSPDWGYRRMLDTPEGGRQAYERLELSDRLQDRVWLAQFGPGTVGAAYRAFIEPQNFTAYGLAADSRKVADTEIEAAHPRAWYARRLRDVHDIWHVLTGYHSGRGVRRGLFPASDPQRRIRPDRRRRGGAVHARPDRLSLWAGGISGLAQRLPGGVAARRGLRSASR